MPMLSTSINPYDWHGLRGEPYIARLISGYLGLRGPKLSILGCDMAGRVEAFQRDLARQPLSAKELGAFAAVVLDPPHGGAAAHEQRRGRDHGRRRRGGRRQLKGQAPLSWLMAAAEMWPSHTAIRQSTTEPET